jgi:hypothetical protein
MNARKINRISTTLWITAIVLISPKDAMAHGEQIGYVFDVSICITFLAIALTRNIHIKLKILLSGTFLLLHGLAWVLLINSYTSLNFVNTIFSIMEYVLRNEGLVFITWIYLIPIFTAILLYCYFKRRFIKA